MQQTIDTVQITRFNSENAQFYMFSNLPKRIEILEREQYLFLPKNWGEDEDLIALRFIANQRGYTIEYAEKSNIISSDLILKEIETAIKKVSKLDLCDYAVRNRKQHLFFLRVIYQTIALEYKIDYFLISQKLNKDIELIRQTESKHINLYQFTPEYKRLFNEIKQSIIENQII